MINKIVFGFFFESDPNVYRNRFIKAFQYLTPTGGNFWINCLSRIKGRRVKLIKGRRAGIEWAQVTIFNEILHILCFIFMMVLNVWIFVQGKLVSTLIVLLLNLVINLPTIFLQRYNRLRLIKIYKISKKEMLNI